MTNETLEQAARRLFASKIAAGYVPRALHAYVNEDGQPVYWRARLEHPDGDAAPEGRKIIRPLHANGSGYKFGEPDFNAGKPIYNLDRIAANPDAPVHVVEGEKAADALTKLGAIATTSGGADSAGRADWSPLACRTCILWPDNDDAGREYMGNVAAILEPLDCELSAIDINGLNLLAKGDAYDWLAERPEASLSDLLALQKVQPRPLIATTPQSDLKPSWPSLDDAARHGLVGELLAAIEPQTEADAAAVLIQLLTAFGIYVGRNCYVPVEGDRHYSNLFVIIVGNTSAGRKGTSFGRVRQVFDDLPAPMPRASGLASGEGLKYAVRDASGNEGDKGADPGAHDKRLLVVESEFAQVLKVCERNGSTLSVSVREFWDTGTVQTLTKNDQVKATDAHVGIIGHITPDELRAELHASERANGFGNRFLYVCAKRSRVLPFGGERVDVSGYVERLLRAAMTSRERPGPRLMDAEARRIWEAEYEYLTTRPSSLYGSITGRAAPQCLRLALCYSLLDESPTIGAPHLRAALALWRYCEESARHIFGCALGDPVADEILAALHAAGDDGVTRTEIRDLFKRHANSERIGMALDLLRARGLAHCSQALTGGRPSEVWRSGTAT